jgi:hypothetical protein
MAVRYDVEHQVTFEEKLAENAKILFSEDKSQILKNNRLSFDTVSCDFEPLTSNLNPIVVLRY